MTDTRGALIIGGGIAGPVTAMALRKAGIEATVYEAYQHAADGVGGGLGIAPNGQTALAAIGAGDIPRSIGTPMKAMVIESWTGKRLAEFGSPPELPVMQFVWRSELYRSLYDEAAARGIAIEHGKRFVGFDETADGIVAHFDDGSSASGDVLIGADGLRSAVRGVIDPNAPAPRYGGLLSFGGRLRDLELAPTGGNMHMQFGKRAFFGYQVEQDGTGGWFCNLPSREMVSLEKMRRTSPEEWLRVMIAAAADDRGPVSGLLRRTDPAELLVVGPMEDLPKVPVWSRGRAVLVGDSAHATSPSSGQGASLAMESAVQLARCLRDLPHHEAFAEYERLRRARCERIIAMGARTNQNKAAGPVGRVIRDAVMPPLMRTLAKPEKLAWQYDYPIDWDAPVRGGGAVGAAA